MRPVNFLKVCLLLFFFGFINPCAATDIPDVQDQQAQKDFTEKLDLQISKKKLSHKECKKLGAVDERRESELIGGGKTHLTIEFEGYVYTLEFKNRSDIDFRNLAVECRFYYGEKRSWRAKQSRTESTQKHIDRSFKIPNLLSAAEYSTETQPFIIQSYSLPSGVYYTGGSAEVLEALLQGLWVRVSRTNADGTKTYVDFCEPDTLSSKVNW